jgi:predicted patatin/cPLA2 family phospholipase
MDFETAKSILGIEKDLKQMCEDYNEMKQDIKDLKKEFTSMEKFNNLEEKVVRIESNLGKIVWVIIIAVVGAVLSLVIK